MAARWLDDTYRHGEVAYSGLYGVRALDSGEPVGEDTLWRIYSMTKPITTVAAMMLWEEGRLELTDPISRWLPEFEAVRAVDSAHR